jgi:hypothetical protein
MREVGLPFADKYDGLLNLKRSGWVLVDATYEPVNQHGSKPIRNEIIERDYPKLCEDLAQLSPDRSVPVVLIKANVCELLEVRLMHDGFKVLNRGVRIPFPANGHQIRFREPFRAALALAAGRRQLPISVSPRSVASATRHALSRPPRRRRGARILGPQNRSSSHQQVPGEGSGKRDH